MSDSELRLEALKLAISLDRLGKPPAAIVDAAEEFYQFLLRRSPAPARLAA